MRLPADPAANLLSPPSESARRRLRRLLATLPAVLLLAMVARSPAIAQSNGAGDGAGGFAGYVQLLAARARADGVSEATIARMTQGLSFNPRVVALDRGQPGGAGGGISSPGAGGSFAASRAPPFAPYRREHVDDERIAGGKRMYAAAATLLPAIERRYGVPTPILLAIWGHETNYGRYTGDFDLARSLASLAYDGRRRELFAGEFVALLRMADDGIPAERLKGSWAGALGNPQFLPSVYLRLAADGDGDGARDIWTSRADTLASIANYFRDAGWRAGDPWGVAASIPAGLDRKSLTNRLRAPSCGPVHARHSRWLTVAEWRQLGVTPLPGTAGLRDDALTTLFQPDGPGTPAWLLTGNYRVILQYNCSNFYALSVGLLADAIAR